MKKCKRSIISGVLVLAMCMGTAVNVQATTIEEAQEIADQLDEEKEAAEAEKNALTDQLNQIIGEMNVAQERLTNKQAEIRQAEDDLVQAKVDENTQYQSMKKRIRYMYEVGNTQFIEVLLNSENMGDFLNNVEYVNQLSEYDRDRLADFQKIRSEVEARERALQEEYVVLRNLQDALIAKQAEVEQLLADKNLQIADLEGQIGENAALLEELIRQAEEEKRKQEEQAAAAAAAAAAEAEAAARANGGSTYIPSTDVVVSGNGQFTNPCPSGSVSSTFGYRTFDNSFHNGLDLAASSGAPTYAADSGTVLIAGWSDSAGNWVVVDHGNGFVTKYMHHSALAVTAGQSVSKGQQVGYVGSTGYSSGPHLHFQVELGGSPVNPQIYL
ncbi:murein hydrolase activator EnvC family protein [Schaedlerella arabinosiphila]|uniref:murein hydrolase activator EnvC family protein n=1 Tax=Schaedlerella arabinosiphila TaxID=2044587 RepID=UPI0025581752|nr:M23 family metallopeptidase [Schaedlerella arabinosiphila]